MLFVILSAGLTAISAKTSKLFLPIKGRIYNFN
jgi:hypothetical protein